MKEQPTRKTRRRSTAKASVYKSRAEAAANATLSFPVQFAADRANDTVDSVHARAKAGIAWVQQWLMQADIGRVWTRAQPVLVRAGRFVRQQPMRSSAIVAFAAGAALLTRTAGTPRT